MNLDLLVLWRDVLFWIQCLIFYHHPFVCYLSAGFVGAVDREGPNKVDAKWWRTWSPSLGAVGGEGGVDSWSFWCGVDEVSECWGGDGSDATSSYGMCWHCAWEAAKNERGGAHAWRYSSVLWHWRWSLEATTWIWKIGLCKGFSNRHTPIHANTIWVKNDWKRTVIQTPLNW